MTVQQAGPSRQSSRRRFRALSARRGLLMVALAGSLLLVGGCREEEQGRPLVYDKGTYQGQADEKLADDQVEALRQRAARQRI